MLPVFADKLPFRQSDAKASSEVRNITPGRDNHKESVKILDHSLTFMLNIYRLIIEIFRSTKFMIISII